jgi:hypothetical protein
MFYSTLTGVIGHLRRQKKLVADTKSTCPTVASTRWLSLGRVTKWLSKHREVVLRHLDEKAPACAPPPSLWVLLLSIEAFMGPVDVFFKRMKGLTTVFSEQFAMLDKLAGHLRDILEMNCQISNCDMMEMSQDDACVTSKDLSADRSSFRDMFADLGHFSLSRYTALADDDKERLEFAVGKLFLNAREGITAIAQSVPQVTQYRRISYPMSFHGISGI